MGQIKLYSGVYCYHFKTHYLYSMPQCLFIFLILKHICQFAAKSTYLFISHGNDWPSSRHLTVDIKSHSNWGMNSLYENVWNNIMLQDMSRVKWCRGPEAIPLAGDWGAAGHIHLDQWQSSIRLDQSEAKDEQRSRTSIFFIQKKNSHEGRTCTTYNTITCNEGAVII